MEYFTSLITGLVLLVVSSFGGYTLNYFRLRKKDIDKNTERITELENELDSVKRVLVILATRLDKDRKQFHGSSDDYEELVKDILTTEILGMRKSAI